MESLFRDATPLREEAECIKCGRFHEIPHGVRHDDRLPTPDRPCRPLRRQRPQQPARRIQPRCRLQLRQEPRHRVRMPRLARPRVAAATAVVGHEHRGPRITRGRKLGAVPVGDMADASVGERVADLAAPSVALDQVPMYPRGCASPGSRAPRRPQPAPRGARATALGGLTRSRTRFFDGLRPNVVAARASAPDRAARRVSGHPAVSTTLCRVSLSVRRPACGSCSRTSMSAPSDGGDRTRL